MAETESPGEHHRRMLTTPSELAATLQQVEYLLLDIDGVIWSGDAVIDGVPEALEHLKSLGKTIRFVSNNTLYTRETIAAKFVDRGILGVKPEDIYSAAYACGLLLQERYPAADNLVHGNVYVLGPPGLRAEVEAVLAPSFFVYGEELLGVPYHPDFIARSWSEPLLPAPRKRPQRTKDGGEKDAAMAAAESAPATSSTAEVSSHRSPRVSLRELNFIAVVVAVDFDLSMSKLACAAAVLQKRGDQTLFIGANPDPADPAGGADHHAVLPSSGAVIAFLTTAVDRPLDILCGKPSPTLGELFLNQERHRRSAGDHSNSRSHATHQDGTISPARCLMVGDRLMTDIRFGKLFGARTALVLSGAEKPAAVVRLREAGQLEEVPDVVIESLASVLEIPLN